MLRSAIALFFEKGYKKIAKSAVLNMDFQTRVEDIIQMENLEMQKKYQTLENRKTKLNHIEAETERIGSEVGAPPR